MKELGTCGLFDSAFKGNGIAILSKPDLPRKLGAKTLHATEVFVDLEYFVRQSRGDSSN